MAWQDPDSTVLTTTPSSLPNLHLIAGAAVFMDLWPLIAKTYKFYVTTILYVSVLCFSTFFNVTFLILLFCSSKQFRERTFVRLLWHVVIANVLTCLSNIVVTVPLTFLTYSEVELALFKTSSTYTVFKLVGSFAVELNLLLTLLIAVQRLLVFISTKLTSLLFEGFIFYVVVLTAWLVTFFVVFTLHYYKCLYIWDSDKLMYLYGCHLNPSVYENISQIMEFLVISQNIAVPILVFISYVIIFYKIYAQRQSSSVESNVSYEYEVLKQAFLIFILFEIPSIYSLLIPNRRIHTETAFIFNRIDMTLNLLAGALTPVLFLATNTEMKTQFKWLSLLKPKIGVKVVSSFDPPRPGVTVSSAAPPYRYARNPV